MSYYGNIECKECKKETRFLIESAEGNELKTIGDRAGETISEKIGEIECDFCIAKNKVYIEIKENEIKSFRNEKNKENKTNIKETETTEKIYEIFESEYEYHPIAINEYLEINNETYEIKRAWKKEYTETETAERFIEEIEDQYIYQLESKDKKIKYATVTDTKQKYLYYHSEELEEEFTDIEEREDYNGVISDFLPTGLDKEELIELDQGNMQEEIILEEKMGENYIVIKETHRGFRAYVYDQDGIILYDIYKETAEDVMEEVDSIVLLKNN